MSFLSPMARKGLAFAVLGTTLTVAMTDDAEARWRRHGHRGGAIAAAAIGGLAAGALIASAGSAYASPSYGYGYGYTPVYSYGPSYSYAAHNVPATYSQGGGYYAPAYATRTHYAPQRPRRVYRYASYREPICQITRKKVWLDSHTYTFRRVTRCY
ncbi:MAG TPA: hypothetical protein PLQ11_11640 [Beijerinckiaceae bacterium]|nr:hypothetical protein [Beijerinckiaceae bacterium]